MDTEDRDHFKTIANLSAVRPDGSRRPPSGASSPSDLDPAYCLNRTRVLFSCYRKDEAHDADLYCAAVASVLAGYAKAVVDHITDPRTGIASEMKWLPAVAEVRSYCNQATARMELHARVDKRVAVPFVPPPLKPGQIDSVMFAELVAEGKIKPRPIGPFEQAGDEWNRGLR